MRLLEILRLRVKSVGSSEALDADMDEEIRYHLEREAEELQKQGLSPAEARRRAALAFGPGLTIAESCREARGVRYWQELNQDARYAVRSFLRAPALTAAALVTIALGIGANTAVFNLVYAVILRPLPFPNPDELVWVTQYFPRFDARLVSGNDFLTWQRESRSFDALAAWSAGEQSVRFDDFPERLRGVAVSPGYFPALGVEPLAGRHFSAEEHEPQGAPAVMLGERLWRDRFASNMNVIGQSLRIGEKAYTIVGVAPEKAGYVEPGDFWSPLQLSFGGPGEPILLVRVLGRLKPGIDAAAARTDLEVLARRAQEEGFGGSSDSVTEVLSLHERLAGNARQSLFLLWGAAGLVLALACANVANLLLTRMAGRTHEISLKLSLGAGGSRILRQLMTESLVLALAGAAASVLLAWQGTQTLIPLLPAGAVRQDVRVDGTMLAFAMGAGVFAALVCGILPAWQATRGSLAQTLRSTSQAIAGARGANRLQGGLVVVQFCLATVLAFAASLLVETFLNLRAVEPGFSPDGLLTAELQFPRGGSDGAERAKAAGERALEHIRAIPGVDQASLATGLPYSALSGNFAFFSVEGAPPWPQEEAPLHRTLVQDVSDDFFATLRIPLAAGVPFDQAGGADGLRAAVVSETFAARAFAGDDPIGRRFKLGIPEGPDPWLTVVGVAGDVRQSAFEADDAPPVLYRRLADAPSFGAAALAVRSGRDAASLAPELRTALLEADPTQALQGLTPMSQRMAAQRAPERDRALLLGCFAALAVALACSGVFGVLSHAVARRKREIGIRMALGAGGGAVFGQVARHGLGLAALGTAFGCAGALASARLLEAFLFEVEATGWKSLLSTSAALLAVAFLACYLPAKRASELSAAAVLRSD